MKQANVSAFSASGLGQTLDGEASPFVAAKNTQAARVGNKSRARSCYGLSASPAASDGFESSFAGRNQPGPNISQHNGPRSERAHNCALVQSFESQPSTETDRRPFIHHQPGKENERDNDCNKCQPLIPPHNKEAATKTTTTTVTATATATERPQEEDQMSQTIQSIQSLSMQLNRAASLSASLDDAMSVSQEIQSAANSNGSAGGKRLTKLVGKKAARMKEILLQNLGKAHKTTDELFEMYEENFYKQQAQAVRIQKEFKTYLASLKGAQDAGKNLNLCIQHSTGVYQSARHDLVCENLSQLDILNEDLLDKLRCQIQVSLSEYMSQFSELREKILKRKRKLIDYDSSRRVYEITLASMQRKRQTPAQQVQAQSMGPQGAHLQGLRSLRPSFIGRSSTGSSSASSGQPAPAQPGRASTDCIQSAASKLVDEARLLKLREQYNYCKIMFETINGELYQELPMVYEKKMKHLLITLQNYFSLEAQFHSNAGKLYATAGDVIDELPMSIHRSQQQNPLIKQQQQQQPIGHKSKDSNNNDGYIINHKASGSSGVGSSRGDSSLESSSSPDNSVNGSSSPMNADRCVSPLPLPLPLTQVQVQSQSIGDKSGDEQQEATALTLPADLEEGSGKELPPSSSVSTIDESTDVGDISCQLDSLSMDFGDSCPPDSVDTHEVGPLELHQQQQGAHDDNEDDDDDDDQQASTSEGSSCSVIEVKPASSSKESGGCLYKVKTSYKYLAEDVDELCFEADEIIQVVEFEENQDREEGWLVGVREVNGQKGLFPSNFTQPLN